jgi:hypothetical protein
MQVEVLILNRIAPGCRRRGIDRVGQVGIDGPAVRIEIDRTDVQGLMQVAQEMGEHEERLLSCP